MPNTSYGPKVYRQQGGDRLVVASGGSLDVESGGEIDIESGGSLKLAGTAIAATASEINRATDVSGRIVTATAATLAVDEATHEGKTVVLDRATGVAVTLPAATGGGARYRFVNKTAVSGGSHTFTTTGNDTIRGVIYGDDGDGEPANAWAAGASDEVVTMDGSTQGGAVGDWVEFEDIAADLWAVRGSLTQTGSEATPFSSAA